LVRHAEPILKQLSQSGFDLVYRLDLANSCDEDQLIGALQGAWGAVAGGQPFTRKVLNAASDLRVIARPGVGYDAIDVSAATERGIAVLITPGANTESVADLAVTLILACVRQLLPADAAVRSGVWRRPELSDDLFEATVGIVGFGQIGQAVAKRLRGFECKLLAVEPSPNPEACQRLGVELVTLGELLPRVDVLTLHVPLSATTHHLIGEREFQLMRRHPIVVNTSRGPVIDEAALVSAIRKGAIRGAGLDVFEREPLPQDHRFTQLANVVLTGHVASFTQRAAAKMMNAVVSGLLSVAEGTTPRGCVNPDALKRGDLAAQS
jgi:phosphoglycerate dehydrogenase-like enzyme